MDRTNGFSFGQARLPIEQVRVRLDVGNHPRLELRKALLPELGDGQGPGTRLVLLRRVRQISGSRIADQIIIKTPDALTRQGGNFRFSQRGGGEKQPCVDRRWIASGGTVRKHGYIHNDAAPDDIAHTILEMKAGASPISPMIARRVLCKYHVLHSNQAIPPMKRAEAAIHDGANLGDKHLLSGREQQVLELISRGFSYAEIARLKAVSVHTVQTHIKNFYSKLAVHSRSEAVFEATRMGLLPKG
ncbi:MAG: LuxR C-terminal-related transcriptional regulator [Polaromonas sp.]